MRMATVLTRGASCGFRLGGALALGACGAASVRARVAGGVGKHPGVGGGETGRWPPQTAGTSGAEQASTSTLRCVVRAVTKQSQVP